MNGRKSNEADGENNSFNVVSDMLKGMNKGFPGKNKNLMWFNRNILLLCVSYILF